MQFDYNFGFFSFSYYSEWTKIHEPKTPQYFRIKSVAILISDIDLIKKLHENKSFVETTICSWWL